MKCIPSARPFLGTEAIAAGLATRRTLKSRHRRIFRNVYIPSGVALTPLVMAEAAWLFADRKVPLAGISAAAVHGAKWLDDTALPEIVRPGAGCRGVVVHRREPVPDEITERRGLPVTTPARTVFDLGRRRGRLQALIRCDAVANVTRLEPEDVSPLVSRYPGSRGLVQLREVLSMMDNGAESPQETRTRLVLLDAGLRRPTTQIPVYDTDGYAFARIDMGYEEFNVGIEYDGIQHWTDPKQRARDIERRLELAERGWTIIHVTSIMLDHRPWVFVQRVVDALEKAGCAWLGERRLLSREFAKRAS